MDQDAVAKKNKAVVRRMLEAFNTGNTDVVTELLHPNIKDHSNLIGMEADLRSKPTVQRVQTEILLEHQAFSNIKFKEEMILAEGDTVMLRWSATGKHNGPLFGRKATGKEIKVFGTEFVTIQDGKIVEHRDDGIHVLDLLRQLGWLDVRMRRKLGVE